VLYKGTYYFCELETDSQREDRLNMDDTSKLMTYMGHKFESYITNGMLNGI
jgi:hypothetical protein